MTRDEVLAMAKKCGAKEVLSYNRFSGPVVLRILDTELERFAALVAAAEREECAKDKVDAERYRWLCADMPGSDEADARYRVLQRMDMMGKGAIDSEIDNWRIK